VNETETPSGDSEPVEVPETPQPAATERPSVGVDLAARPSGEWLGAVESELDDTDLVLKCLARDSAKMCETCDKVKAAGGLDSRPMLARCASTKQPR